MSSYHVEIPQADQIDYHADRQVQRVEQAFKTIDPGDVLALVDDRIAQEPDLTKHPMYGLTLFLLDRTTACDGGQLYDDCRRLVIAAINTCLDEALSRGEG
jgi:hypothetical protein